MDRPDRARGLVVAAVAGLAGVVAALSPPAPTGRPGVDAVMVGLSVAAVSYVAARAPWWAVAVLAGAALTIAIDPVLIGIALVALVGALWAGARPATPPAVLAISAGVSLNVLARAELAGSFGASAIVAIAAALLVFVLGLRSQPRALRRTVWIVSGSLAVLAVAAAAGFGLAVAEARDDLTAGVRYAERAVSALEGGDFDQAAADFDSAADVLDRAHGQLASPWAAGASLVPVLAQHRTAAVDMSGVGSSGAAEVADAIREIDLDSLRSVNGRIDVAAVAALRDPFTRVHAALDRLSAAARDSGSPWLVNRARFELDDFETSVAEHLPSLENAISATELAPAMLGADGPRTYLLLFTTPSEARGLGGFVGNYAELTVDDGQLRLGEFGRAQALDELVAEAGTRLDDPQEFVERYGRFGYDVDGNGLVGNAGFRNLTMTPHFPWVGEVAAEMYESATGRAVDGVISVDPFVVAKLLTHTGPVELTTVAQQLSPDNAAAYLLRDQYVVAGDNQRRVDALAEAAELTFGAALAGSLPSPPDLARDLGPLAADRRLLIWSPDEAEQQLFRDVNMAGEIPAHDGADGWSVAVTNGGGNKIDAFLERAASYESQRDPATGETTGTLRFTVTNTAPAEGLPNYVIGNLVGLPKGTNRMYVSFYSPLALTGARIDGEPAELEVGRETGWNVYSTFVDVPPGGTKAFELTLAGETTPAEELVTWEQPMALPLQPLDGG
jgi:hypothetical protein